MRHIIPLLLFFVLLFPIFLLFVKNSISQFKNSEKEAGFSIGRIFVIALLLFFALLFYQKTNSYLGQAPIATDDDAIANVATNLWKSHSYGFPASPSIIHFGLSSEPILKEKHFDGTYKYYNYGWFYFVAGGFLNWVFGDNSLHFYRMLNVWGVLFVITLGTLIFSNHSLLPLALMAIGLMGRFLSTVAPIMSRPDIAVSVTATLFFVFTYLAFQRKNSWLWASAGFWAATASTSHLVAWTISLSALLTWICFWFTFREEKKIIIQSFLGLCIGGFTGIFLYLYMMGFRIFDLLHFVRFLNKNVRHQPFFEQFITGVKLAWTGSSYTYSLAFLGILLSISFFIFAFKIKKPYRAKIFSLVAAPLISLILYMISLGFYRSLLHPKYGIFIYITSFWLVAVGVSTLLDFYREIFTRKWPVFEKALVPITCVFLIFSTYTMACSVPMLERQSIGWIDFDKFREKVLEPILENSFVWGSVIYGYESGLRTTYLDLSSALAFSIHQSVKGQLNSSPDFIVTDYFTTQSYFLTGPLLNRDNPYALLSKHVKPGESLRPVRVVYAPPYGNTYVYKKFAAHERNIPISVAYNDGVSSQWLLELEEEETNVYPQKTAAVKIDSREHNGKIFTSDESNKIVLNRGVYSISVQLSEQYHFNQTPFLLLTNGMYEYFDSNSRLSLLPFFKGQKVGTIIIDHQGGDLFLSLFSGKEGALKRGDNFKIISVHKLQNLAPFKSEEKIAIPRWEGWTANIIDMEKGENNTLIKVKQETQSTEAEPIVLKSPIISLKPLTIYQLQVPAKFIQGAAKIAIRTPNNQSLLYGESYVLRDKISFKTDRSGRVVFQIIGIYSLDSHSLEIELGEGNLYTQVKSIKPIQEMLQCPTSDYEEKKNSPRCSPVEDSTLERIDETLGVI